MIPITRKELYLNKIVGNDDYSVPEKPISEEEFFFAEILGEAVQAPEPLTRYQMYLAKIAGHNIEIPTPITRLEHFLARAAGLDITVPVPITREEMLWADYALIVEKELSGIPPLTFKAIAGVLKNYRIYGNTADGKSVGDRTANLFDGELVDGYHIGQNGLPSPYAGRCCITTPIAIDTENLFISYTAIDSDTRCMYSVLLNGELVRRVTNVSTGQAIDASGGNELYLCFYMRFGDALASTDISNIMLNTGSTPLPYEPYGYKIPVILTAGSAETTDIYLGAPLAKSGNSADYIDYATQKRHNSDGTESSITLPEIAVTAGTNTLTVGTEVQPSGIEIKGRIQEVTP